VLVWDVCKIPKCRFLCFEDRNSWDAGNPARRDREKISEKINIKNEKNNKRENKNLSINHTATSTKYQDEFHETVAEYKTAKWRPQSPAILIHFRATGKSGHDLSATHFSVRFYLMARPTGFDDTTMIIIRCRPATKPRTFAAREFINYIYFEGLEIVWHYEHMMVLSLRTL
jgi:hypothetical protein